MKLNLSKATKIAINAAKQSNERHRMGAILYDRSKYVVGFNRVFSGCEVSNKQTPYSDHAEASVINHGLHTEIDMRHSTLVVVRVGKRGNLLLAKPCRHCTKLIKSMNIPHIYYSSDPLHRELISKNFKSL